MNKNGHQPVSRRRPVPRQVPELVGAVREPRDEEDVGVVQELDEVEPFRAGPRLAHHDLEGALARLGPEERPDEPDEEAEGQLVFDAEGLLWWAFGCGWVGLGGIFD